MRQFSRTNSPLPLRPSRHCSSATSSGAIQDALVTAHSAQKTPDNFEAKIGTKVPTKLKFDAMPAPLINEEPILKEYDFVKLENELLVVDPMDSSVVAVIPRKFPKDQATQGSAPSGQTHDPASQGDEAETTKKN
jgi:hypothetical protein